MEETSVIFKMNGTTIAIIDNFPRKLRKDYVEQFGKDKYGETHLHLIEIEDVVYDEEKQIVDFIGEWKNTEARKDWL